MQRHHYLILILLMISQLASADICSKASENKTANLTCPTGQKISKVTFANYGLSSGSCGNYKINGCSSSTSKSAVESLCLGKSSCQVTASNSVFGDPCVGVNKTLVAQVTCAVPLSTQTTACSKVSENQNAVLSCPVGQVISSVSFASYGLPSGSCGSLAVNTSCNASSSKSVVEQLCLGKASCTVGALNSLFGDPCSGKTKSLGIQVVCKTSTPTPTPTPVTVGSTIVPPALTIIPSNTLPIPTNIANGTTVSLQCGQVYRGTLDLNRKSDIIVNVAGTCGKPTIIPLTNAQDGISAVFAKNITVSGVKIQSAFRGININDAEEVSILNTDILNSRDSGIYSSGIVGMKIIDSSISASGKTGIDGGSWVVKGQVSNTTVTDSGSAGGAYTGIGIYFGDGNNNTIDHVTVKNSVYHGLVVLHNSFTAVKNSIVSDSCTGPDKDCGAIYTGARDKLPLTLLIEGNQVRKSGGIGIYLDDFSNGVTVTKNDVTSSDTGIVLHNAFDTKIISNTIYSNNVTHIALSQDIGQMQNNEIASNTITSTKGEVTYNLQTGDLKAFAKYHDNLYKSTNVNSFGRLWDGKNPGVTINYSDWKAFTGQELNSTMNGIP